MQQIEMFLLFTRPMDAAGIRYMVSGSVASMVYGEPRLTNVVDIVITLDPSRVSALEKSFPEDVFYCPPSEVMAIEARRSRRGHFNIIHHATGLKADIYLAGSDPFQAWGLEHRASIEILPGQSLWLAPMEYVILKKLEYYREGRSEKHLYDIRGMMDISGESMDRKLLDEHLRKMKLESEWAEVMRKA